MYLLVEGKRHTHKHSIYDIGQFVSENIGTRLPYYDTTFATTK